MKQIDFWGRKDIIKEFSLIPTQDYWEDFFSKIQNKERKKVLDLGCGAGRYAEMLLKMGFPTYACDRSKNMLNATKLRVGKDKNKVVKLELASMLDLPYKDEFFDIILANGLFHNAETYEELQKSISEAVRILKKEGYLCINMFYKKGRNESLKQVRPNIYSTKDDLLMTLLDKKGLLKLFKSIKLYPESVETYERVMNVGKRDILRGIFIRR